MWSCDLALDLQMSKSSLTTNKKRLRILLVWVRKCLQCFTWWNNCRIIFSNSHWHERSIQIRPTGSSAVVRCPSSHCFASSLLIYTRSATSHLLPLNNGNASPSQLNHYSDMQFTNIHSPNILGLLGCKSDLQKRITRWYKLSRDEELSGPSKCPSKSSAH